jgi:hypothetical protein
MTRAPSVKKFGIYFCRDGHACLDRQNSLPDCAARMFEIYSAQHTKEKGFLALKDELGKLGINELYRETDEAGRGATWFVVRMF